MKGSKQLARSCRQLGREGVGARRAGTRARTWAAPAPRHKPRGPAPRPAPCCCCHARSAGRGTPKRCRGRGRNLWLSLLSPLCVFYLFVGLFWVFVCVYLVLVVVFFFLIGCVCLFGGLFVCCVAILLMSVFCL